MNETPITSAGTRKSPPTCWARWSRPKRLSWSATLEGCERCRAEIRWLTPAINALPEGVERLEPPRELRERVMAEVRFDAAPEDAPAGEPATRALRPRRRLAARARLRPDGAAPRWRDSPPRSWSSPSVAGFAIGGGDRHRRRRPDQHRGHRRSAGGVTAKMISEGDSGTLHLANVKQLPSDRVLEAWVQRDGEVEPVEALFVPDRKARRVPNSLTWTGSKSSDGDYGAGRRQRIADLLSHRHHRRAPVGARRATYLP